MMLGYADAAEEMARARTRFSTQRSAPSMDVVAWMVTDAPDRLIQAARPKSVRSKMSGRAQPHTLGALLVAILEEAQTYGHVYQVGGNAEFVARALAVIYPMMDAGRPGFKGIEVMPRSREYRAIFDGGVMPIWFEQAPGKDPGIFAEHIEFEVTRLRAMAHFRSEPMPPAAKLKPANPSIDIERLGEALRAIG